MERLYSAANLPEAYLIRDLLAEVGVRTQILNENAQGGVGEIPFTETYPEIWVERKNDMERARRIIEEYESRSFSTGYVDCPRCGEQNPENFETCWHCGVPLN
ncbi:MAG: DUF2007 domain-containing protein [Acidiferrobacterales bacterium]